ncbi:three component ABC system middle component [Hyphomicrobium sp.]|uniref:three component ABC system middle component n=1 Tax=Hyphomicrobium sp. TaxID=82 RepID=UPI002FE2B631
MRHDHEERILHNPALTARAFWHFATSFRGHGDGTAPELPLFVIAAAMMFQRDTAEQTFRMQFNSGLSKALEDCPDILAGLQYRIDFYALDALKGLQVACSARLLERVDGRRFAGYRALGSRLPLDIRDDAESVSQIFACVRRLGAWFAAEDIASLATRLRIGL